jgi:hypothetical protein
MRAREERTLGEVSERIKSGGRREMGEVDQPALFTKIQSLFPLCPTRGAFPRVITREIAYESLKLAVASTLSGFRGDERRVGRALWLIQVRFATIEPGSSEHRVCAVHV